MRAWVRVGVALFMCHKREMMDHFFSKSGRTHRSMNPVRRTPSIEVERLAPDHILLDHDDPILDEGLARRSH